MTEQFKPEPGEMQIEQGQEAKIRFNLEPGDTIVSRSGTIRLIEKVDIADRSFTVKKIRGGKVSAEVLGFDTLNSGIGNIAYVRHPDGKMEFTDDEAEFEFLSAEISRQGKAFERGDTMMDMDQIDGQKKRLEVLKEKLGR